MAVTFGGFPARVVLVDIEGGSRLVAGDLAKSGTRAPLWWSPDGKWLAVEVQEGDRTAVHLVDLEAEAQYPLLPDARVQGWREGLLEVVVDGVTRLEPPGKPSAERAREYALGRKPEEAGEIREGDGQVQVGDVSLPVRRRPAFRGHPGGR